MLIYSQIFTIIAPILFISLVGYGWSFYRFQYDAKFVSSIIMNIATPCLIISTMSSAHIDQTQVLQLSLITIVGLLFLAVLSAIVLSLTSYQWRPYFPSLLFSNTGNMGIPIVYFAFGEKGMELALVIFMVTSLFHFSIGVAIVGGKHPLDALIKSPVFYATLIAFICLFTEYTLPVSLFNSMKLMGDMAIPLMIFSLGVSLHSLHIHDLKSSVFFGVMRLLLGFIVGFLLCYLFNLSGIVKGVVLLQATMPSAVFNYLLASTYQQEEQAVAGVVVFSTILSFFTLPVILWCVLGA